MCCDLPFSGGPSPDRRGPMATTIGAFLRYPQDIAPAGAVGGIVRVETEEEGSDLGTVLGPLIHTRNSF